MKITVLAENTSVCPQIGCEHGLSLYIETSQHRILFDMGQTDLFAKNAERLRIDLSTVDIAVISHGHYDHGGGMHKFLEINSTAPVYINRYAFEPHYNGTEKYIGLDTSLKDNKRLIFTGDEHKIDDSLTLYSCSDKKRLFDSGSSGLNCIRDGMLCPEDFRHEQYLMINEGNGRILISGCSHKGILNIAEWFRPDVLIGGFHLMKTDSLKQLISCAEHLESLPTEFYTCHCTGVTQFRAMKPYMSRLHYISSGQIINV